MASAHWRLRRHSHADRRRRRRRVFARHGWQRRLVFRVFLVGRRRAYHRSKWEWRRIGCRLGLRRRRRRRRRYCDLYHKRRRRSRWRWRRWQPRQWRQCRCARRNSVGWLCAVVTSHAQYCCRRWRYSHGGRHSGRQRIRDRGCWRGYIRRRRRRRQIRLLRDYRWRRGLGAGWLICCVSIDWRRRRRRLLWRRRRCHGKLRVVLRRRRRRRVLLCQQLLAVYIIWLEFFQWSRCLRQCRHGWIHHLDLVHTSNALAISDRLGFDVAIAATRGERVDTTQRLCVVVGVTVANHVIFQFRVDVRRRLDVAITVVQLVSSEQRAASSELGGFGHPECNSNK